jgi:hypothetical protein
MTKSTPYDNLVNEIAKSLKMLDVLAGKIQKALPDGEWS